MNDSLKDAILKVKEMIFEDAEFKEKVNDLVHVNGWDDLLHSFSLLWELSNKIVSAVEKVYTEYHMIDESQRIEVAAELLDELIVFKGFWSILEPLDETIFKLILSAAVSALNDKYGNGNWP